MRRSSHALGAVSAAATVALLSFGAGAATIKEFDANACTRSRLAVVVDLDDRRHSSVIAHAEAASLVDGKPRVLHLARELAAEHRRAALAGKPTRPGFDRDEYPPAVSREGGAGAHVAYIVSGENRSAGSSMGAQLRPFCNGQAFIVEAR